MQTRKLGASGPVISAMGYGAMSFSDMYGPATETESHAVLDTCRERGLTHLDTANVYGMGKSERAIGSYFAKNPGAKDDFVIATKATFTTNDAGARILDNSIAHLEAELDGSLQRMGIEQVDLFYAHRRAPNITPEELAHNLGTLVKKGKARAIGLSEVAPNTLRRAHAEHPVAAVQSEYSLWTRAPELGLVQAAAELGVAMVAFSPIGRSMLTDRPLTAEAVADIPFLADNPRFMGDNHARNVAASAPFRAMAAEMGTNAAALANAWLLHQGDHVIPIPGCRSVANLEQCLEAVDLQLSADDLAQIERILPLGWAHGDRYSADQWVGPERYC
ncbi:aldo/keto reductase [Roseobacteraceae bacterium S113]